MYVLTLIVSNCRFNGTIVSWLIVTGHNLLALSPSAPAAVLALLLYGLQTYFYRCVRLGHLSAIPLLVVVTVVV